MVYHNRENIRDEPLNDYKLMNQETINTIATVLADSFTKRKSYLRQNKIEAYRLYNNEDFLALTIDLYLDNAVISILDQSVLALLEDLEQVLRKNFAVKDFFYKDRTKQKIDLPKSNHKQTIIQEYDHKFKINLSDYLDTGLFLDHRETRQWIGQQSRQKTVLNTFAYSGSFSIYAAKGGAAKTYSVDLSKTYCEWIKENLLLNNLPLEQNWVYKMDTLEFFKYALRKKLQFDIIVIDPPTFSKNKGKSFSVKKDHPSLINSALKVLAPDGFILFSNNYLNFELDTAALEPCTIEEKENTIPPDFHGSIPHNCYLIRHRF